MTNNVQPQVIDVSLNTYDWAFKNTGDTTAADEFTQNVNDGTIALMHDVSLPSLNE